MKMWVFKELRIHYLEEHLAHGERYLKCGIKECLGKVDRRGWWRPASGGKGFLKVAELYSAEQVGTDEGGAEGQRSYRWDTYHRKVTG